MSDIPPACNNRENLKGREVIAAETKTANITGTSHKIIIDNSPYPCKPVLEFVVGHPGCRALDIQLSLGLHRGNPKNLEKRREISDCLEILCFSRDLEKRGNLFFPTKKADSHFIRKFTGMNGAPVPLYERGE